jgi:hypothetical protein
VSPTTPSPTASPTLSPTNPCEAYCVHAVVGTPGESRCAIHDCSGCLTCVGSKFLINNWDRGISDSS